MIALAAALPLPASPVAASPGDAPWDGAVFAGPTAPHPANVAANPAALLLTTPGTHFFVGGVGRLEQLVVERRTVDESGATGPGPTARGTTTGAGGHVGALRAWPGGVIAFLATLPPPVETLAGEDALAYHTRGSRSRAFDLATVAAGYRVTSRISLGLAGSYGTRSTVLRFARDTALEAGRDPDRGTASDCGGARCGLEHPAASELWTIDVGSDPTSLDNLSLSGGVLVRLPGEVLFGLTYQRPWRLGRIERTGTARVVAAPRDGGAVLTGETTVYDRVPEIVRLGARSRPLERWDLVGELRWRRLGTATRDDVRTYGGDLAAGGVPDLYPRPRGLRDAVALEVGLEQVELGQVTRLGARLGVDTGAVGAERMSARAPWGRHLSANVGLQVRLAARWVFQLGYGVEYQGDVVVSPGAFDPIDRLDCEDGGHDLELPACATVRAGYGAPTAAGTYGRITHAGRLTLRLELPAR